jgi:Domain of unknown function (DUF4160)
MPRVSEFFGISIWMYYRDHQPPHFHATYGGDEVLIQIGTGDVLEGHLSRRGLRLVQEWEELHRSELLTNWDAARQQQPLTTIPPLT